MLAYIRLMLPYFEGWIKNADGSFGTSLPIPKEKVISTLSALLAIADLPQDVQDGAAHRARTRALRYLYEDTATWQTGPDMAGCGTKDPDIVPTGIV